MRNLRESQGELARYRQRLEDLLAYRREYAERFDKAIETASNADTIKRFMIFIAQVDDGIQQLRRLIQISEQRCEERRDEWLARRARFRTLDEVITRYRGEEERHRVRREQRDADDQTQRPGPTEEG